MRIYARLVAGYSGTPLAKKLGIVEGHTVALVGAPGGFGPELDPLPGGVRIVRRTRTSAPADVVVAFFTRRADLERTIDALGRSVFPAGGLWIAWPKKASRIPTDLDFETIQRIGLGAGLVDNKVCAIDDTWSGIRLVWRKELRTTDGT